MKTTPAMLLFISCLLATGASFAGTVYRCELDGGRSYVSKPVAGAQCHAVSRYTVRRSQVKATITKGLGYFLQNVTVEDYPVMRGNKFYGFKIKAISAELGVDIQPGDVVTRVNGMSIEHPEDADAAMRSLEKASALKVDFERDGKPRTLELPITED